MPTSYNTHDYDGKLRDKWFEIRPMLIERYLPNCLSFDDTIKQIEEWLDKKYYNVKRIGRARRAIRILTSQRRSNFDSKNEIDVEELLPILWDKVKNQEDIHNTFYEQLCDITGGSCSQGRSTRLFQFLFLFDLPTITEEEKKQTLDKDLPKTTIDEHSHFILDEQEQLKSPEQQTYEGEQQSALEEKIDNEHHSHVLEKTEEEHQSQEPDQVEQINSSSDKTE
jgi:hypothetical protein